MSYNNAGWNNAYKQFGMLNQLWKKQQQDDGVVIQSKAFVIKPIPLHRREPLTNTETDLLRGFLHIDDFLVQPVGDSNMATEIPLVFLAASIAQELLGKYTRDTSRRYDQPPKATEAHQMAALKLVKYVPITIDDRVDTTCKLSQEAIEQDQFRTSLSLMAENDTINIIDNQNQKSKTLGLTKRGVDSFLIFDGSRRSSRSLRVMNTEQVISSYKVANHDEPLYIPDKLKWKQ